MTHYLIGNGPKCGTGAAQIGGNFISGCFMQFRTFFIFSDFSKFWTPRRAPNLGPGRPNSVGTKFLDVSSNFKHFPFFSDFSKF